MNTGKPMDPSDLADLLPPIPQPRELPHLAAHRSGLLAALSTEPQEPGPAPRAGRRGCLRAGRWLGPAAAAAAVFAIAIAIALPGLDGGTAAPQPRARRNCAPYLILQAGQNHGLPAGFCARRPPAHPPVRTRTWQVPLTGLRSVVVQTNSGSVTVDAALATGDTVHSRPGSGSDSVAVTAQPSYRGAAPVISSTVSRGVLTISASCPSDDSHCNVSFQVRLPRALPLRASTQLGAVQVSGMTGSVQVYDALGSVRLANLTGPVTATDSLGYIDGTGLTSARASLTADLGDIDVAFTSPPTLIIANDQDGTVTIRVPGTASYAVTASAQLGSSSVTVPRSVRSPHVIRASSQLGDVTVTS